MDDTRLGAILLESGVVREDDLERCLEIQSLSSTGVPMGQILVEQGILTKSTLDDLLAVQALRRSVAGPPLTFPDQGLEGVLREAAALGANDLHLSEGRPALARVGGRLSRFGEDPLGGPEIWEFARQFMGIDVLEAVAEHGRVTTGWSEPGVGRGRMTAYRHFDGLGIMVRLHPDAIRSPAAAGIDEATTELMREGQGLVLVTGNRGHGISETLATLSVEAARTPGRTMLLLDDVFESTLAPADAAAIVCARRVGQHTKSYASGVRAAMHEDCDVIFLADASSPEAFHLAVQAAEAGRLVVAALHADSTVAALEQALGSYAVHDQPRVRTVVASVLQSVLACHLLPAAAEQPGLVMATERLAPDDRARELLQVGAFDQLRSLLRPHWSEIGHSIDTRLVELVNAGDVRFEDAFRFADDKSSMLTRYRAEVS